MSYITYSTLKDKLLPGNLLPRFMWIIIIPALILQILAIYIFYERHWYNVTEHNSRLLANEVKGLIKHIKDDDPINQEMVFLNLKYIILSRESSPTQEQNYPEEIHIFQHAIEEIIGYRAYLGLEGNKTLYLYLPHPHNNNIIKIQLPYKVLINSSTWIFVLWILGLAIVLLSISITFSRNQIRSIIELTKAVENYGLGKRAKGYKPSGANEIRQAGVAFLKMKNRIDRYNRKRTKMLAMISHDLKTPLTRMMLQVALLENKHEREDLKQDITIMKNMIDSYLAFARGEGGEEFEIVEINNWMVKFLESLYPNRPQITLKTTTSKSFVALKESAFSRALSNVIENGLKYATKLEIFVCIQKQDVVIIIEDNGQGIKKEDMHMVFKPFYRADKARSLVGNDSGVGLGLAITKEIVTGHYGNITLGSSPHLKGLMVKITLPLHNAA